MHLPLLPTVACRAFSYRGDGRKIRAFTSLTSLSRLNPQEQPAAEGAPSPSVLEEAIHNPAEKQSS